MSLATWQEILITAAVDGTALTASTTPTSLLPAAAKYTLPAGFFRSPGQVIKVTAHGRVSNIITTPGTLALDIRFGATAVMSGGTMALNIVAKTNVPWWLEASGTVRAIGTTANLIWCAQWTSESVIGSALPTVGGAGTHVLPFNTAPVVGANFDSSASQVIDLFGTWSLNNANSITVHQFKVEALN